MPRANKGAQVTYRKDTGKWGIREFIGGQRHWHVSGLKSREEAEKYLIEVLIDQRREQCRGHRLTVGEIMAEYLEGHIPHTARPEKGLMYHKITTPFWAGLMSQDVNKAKCQQYCSIRNKESIDKRGKPLSSDSLRREIEHISAAFSYAYENERIDRLPRFWKPQKAKAKQRWLTRKEVAALLKVSDHNLKLFILLALYTGTRPTAIFNLKWDDIDLKNGVIDYSKSQKSKTKGFGLVPIPRPLKTFLEIYKQDVGFVINVDGMPIKSNKTAWKTACRRAGIEGATPYTLRHTHASWLKQDGISVNFIAENLGHKDTQMVDRTYGKMNREYMDVIRNTKWGKAA